MRKGNYKYKDLTNQRFGRLVALEMLEERWGDYQEVAWQCACDCGNVKPITRGQLTSGGTKSCGCLSTELKSARSRLRPYESLYNSVKKVAPARGIGFELTYEDFIELTKTTVCHYCGQDVQWPEFNLCKNGRAYNLDRKDNSIGYTMENCIVCCGSCNRMKCEHSYEEFIIHIRRIEQYMRGK